MPDTQYWTDVEAREALLAQGRLIMARIRDGLEAHGVVAIEPQSGDHFWGSTLGKANEAAHAQYPDRWLYFARTDDPAAEIVLPTW